MLYRYAKYILRMHECRDSFSRTCIIIAIWWNSPITGSGRASKGGFKVLDAFTHGSQRQRSIWRKRNGESRGSVKGCWLGTKGARERQRATGCKWNSRMSSDRARKSKEIHSSLYTWSPYDNLNYQFYLYAVYRPSVGLTVWLSAWPTSDRSFSRSYPGATWSVGILELFAVPSTFQAILFLNISILYRAQRQRKSEIRCRVIKKWWNLWVANNQQMLTRATLKR